MFDGPGWTTGRNFYEGVQWTMAYQLHGCLSVYLALFITLDFTTLYRCTIFLFLAGFSSMYGDQLLEGSLFYAGALLAELSLLSSPGYRNASPRISHQRIHVRIGNMKSHWPMIMALWALFISSYPYNGEELMPYSRFLHRCGEIIFPSNCIS